ncbi:MULTISPECIES: GTP-binding protein [Paenibacillus]|uniref:CobW family GTP-binding protein n=1 Tax=Paenibacillus TaxID=44249 RepID=UPI002FE35AA5
MEKRSKATPIYMLSGFLGSGKTTLLQRLLAFWKEQGLRPAVVMNELGEVNLDGMMVGEEVPMTEMLGGCICCSIRSDLSTQLYELIKQEQPDLVVIEATGAANPLEMFDAVTESSLYLELDIRPMITVVDAAHLAELYAKQQGKTYRLMLEQIRCGSDLILNKIDRIGQEQQREMRDLLERLNPYARIIPAVRCEVDPVYLLHDGERAEEGHPAMDLSGRRHDSLHFSDGHTHDSADETHPHHHSHEHVTVYTHYFTGPVDSVEFERFITELPREIYRGKGILSFSDTASRFLFQYAYREADYLKITPQGQVPDVVVFIGEHFDKTKLAEKLSALEGRTA